MEPLQGTCTVGTKPRVRSLSLSTLGVVIERRWRSKIQRLWQSQKRCLRFLYAKEERYHIAERDFRVVTYPEWGCISKPRVASGAIAPWVREPMPPYPFGVKSHCSTASMSRSMSASVL